MVTLQICFIYYETICQYKEYPYILNVSMISFVKISTAALIRAIFIIQEAFSLCCVNVEL